ncbi:uncharacterized protein BT62DRAFT_1009350 [Guyanagaster necrorhizus]|uniref:Uncharacterized protein n=1 Tax=Guyanagaster necrorhizus TaxID=856835 RepID=A0A9P8APZ2_9AGAR|nr:uncharacterized protein BT62DRAFT_1009350 [Guyanagaster necrorhizus MCA 3950]KAG7443524.1 hypothetical protein BT62DRAFT_1009350 [Guyanagaster necrorhizus MCA 3950]
MTPTSVADPLLSMKIHQVLQLLVQAPSQGSKVMIQLGKAGSFYDLPTISLFKEEGDDEDTEETESSNPPHPGRGFMYETTDEEELEQEIKKVRTQEYQEH